jgi:sulfhydrogenase subunit gamma (sulfur reductase)
MTNVENSMYQVEVIKIVGLNKSTKSIRFRFVDTKVGRSFSFSPGQFVLLGVIGYGDAVLTITTAPVELPEFEVAVRSIGNSTKALHRLKIGEKTYFKGPFGNSIISRNLYGQKILLIAGGIGLAPLRSIIHTIRDDQTIVSNLTILYGAKIPEDLIYKAELGCWGKFAKVILTVDRADRDWTGEMGRVVDVLNKTKVDNDTVAIICGPPIMYQAVAKILIEKGLVEENIEFMLERRMKCGIGKCQHCTCGDKYVCIDGPTFSWKVIKNNWEA